MSAADHVPDETLLALLAGDLPASDVTPAQSHLGMCPTCQRSRARLAAVHAAFDDDRQPSPFVSARMKRRLSEALAVEVSAPPRLVRRSRAAAAVAFAALSGAAVAMTASSRAPSSDEALDRVEVRAPAVVAEPVRVVPAQPLLLAEPAPPRKVALAPREDRSPPRPRPRATAADRAGPSLRVAVAPGTLAPAEALEAAWEDAVTGQEPADWVALGDAFVQAGAHDRAVDAWVRALDSDAGEAALQRLTSVTREGLVQPEDVVERLEGLGEGQGGAETLRLRCEWGLKHRGDRAAVEACRAFGRSYPAHPAVRSLAIAAGHVAETRLDDLSMAVEEYSRALVVSEYAGVPGSEALLARARARARLGDLPEAQADLRLYLHVAPEAYHRPDIRLLATELRVPPP